MCNFFQIIFTIKPLYTDIMYLMFALRLFTFFALHNFALFSELYHVWYRSVFVHAVTVNCCSSVWSCRSDSDVSCCLWFWKLFTVHVLVSRHRCLSFGSRLKMRSLITRAHFHLIFMQTKDWTNPLLSDMIVNKSVHEAMSHAFSFHIIITFKRFEKTGLHRNDTCTCNIQLKL